MKIKILFGIFATAFLISSALAEEAKKPDTASIEVNDSIKVDKTKKPAAVRASIAGAAQIRSSAAASTAPIPAITPKVVIEEVECGIGEYSKLGKCAPCEQKNNPGVKWANSGKDCKISECIDGYILIDKDKDQPKCLQKCNVWGGIASKEWIRDDAEFSFCGSGKHLECEKGFAKTREQTGSSGTEFGHCVPEGTMTGACKEDGDMNSGKFANGRCMQVCENGFWSGCSLQKFCEKGFKEGNFKDVIFVKDKKDIKSSVFDCTESEK